MLAVGTLACSSSLVRVLVLVSIAGIAGSCQTMGSGLGKLANGSGFNITITPQVSFSEPSVPAAPDHPTAHAGLRPGEVADESQAPAADPRLEEEINPVAQNESDESAVASQSRRARIAALRNCEPLDKSGPVLIGDYPVLLGFYSAQIPGSLNHLRSQFKQLQSNKILAARIQFLAVHIGTSVKDSLKQEVATWTEIGRQLWDKNRQIERSIGVIQLGSLYALKPNGELIIASTNEAHVKHRLVAYTPEADYEPQPYEILARSAREVIVIGNYRAVKSSVRDSQAEQQIWMHLRLLRSNPTERPTPDRCAVIQFGINGLDPSPIPQFTQIEQTSEYFSDGIRKFQIKLRLPQESGGVITLTLHRVLPNGLSAGVLVIDESEAVPVIAILSDRDDFPPSPLIPRDSMPFRTTFGRARDVREVLGDCTLGQLGNLHDSILKDVAQYSSAAPPTEASAAQPFQVLKARSVHGIDVQGIPGLFSELVTDGAGPSIIVVGDQKQKGDHESDALLLIGTALTTARFLFVDSSLESTREAKSEVFTVCPRSRSQRALESFRGSFGGSTPDAVYLVDSNGTVLYQTYTLMDPTLIYAVVVNGPAG